MPSLILFISRRKTFSILLDYNLSFLDYFSRLFFFTAEPSFKYDISEILQSFSINRLGLIINIKSLLNSHSKL
jgi:hypothetical protein